MQIDSIEVCGKTGTVENKTFNDHSVFIAFAPKDEPKIAIAVYIDVVLGEVNGQRQYLVL